MIALLYGSGLRISEALALRPKDLELDDLAVSVQSGKGRRRRVAALFPDAVDAVLHWIDRRGTFGVSPHDPLFCTVGRGAAGSRPTAPGQTLSREYVACFLRRIAKRAGLAKRVHPHGFRHSHADLLRRRGWDVEEIRRQLGHRSLQVTSQYLDHIGAHELPTKIRGIGPILAPASAAKDARRELGELFARLGYLDVEQIVALLKRA